MSPEKNMLKADKGNTQNAQKPKKRRHKLVKKFINEKSIPESLTPEKKSIMAMSCKGGSYGNCGYGSYQRGDGYRNYQGDNGYGSNHHHRPNISTSHAHLYPWDLESPNPATGPLVS